MHTTLLTPLLNRAAEFDPAGWFHLVVKGRHPLTVERADGTRRTIVQLVDDKSTAAMLAAFNRKKSADPSYRMLVDFEHFSHQKDKSTEAAVWVDALENRANGIWFQGEWSDLGASAVKNKRYRTISPVWFPAQTEEVEPGVYRPLEINDAGLTNKNNLQGLVPFWNRESPGREATTENQNHSHMKERLLLLCGLAATATDDQVCAAVEAFKNRASTLETLTAEHTALKNRHDALLGSSVDHALEEFKGVITEAAKPAWKNRLTADFPGTVELLKGVKAPVAPRAPVHQVKGVDTTVKLSAEGEALLNRTNGISAAATDLVNTGKEKSFDSAWQRATREYDAAHPAQA